jgi:hypothetical protein
MASTSGVAEAATRSLSIFTAAGLLYLEPLYITVLCMSRGKRRKGESVAGSQSLSWNSADRWFAFRVKEVWAIEDLSL